LQVPAKESLLLEHELTVFLFNNSLMPFSAQQRFSPDPGLVSRWIGLAMACWEVVVFGRARCVVRWPKPVLNAVGFFYYQVSHNFILAQKFFRNQHQNSKLYPKKSLAYD
jgi:hypothetical protein